MRTLPRTLFVLAGVVGSVHALFSIFWGLGGRWLVSTLGTDLVSTLRSMTWVLVPVGLIKLAVAWFPLARPARTRPGRWSTTLIAVGLCLWGGVNTLVGNLVLTHVIHPRGGYDREGLIGHAWLWDPMFLVWGVLLSAGLVMTGDRAGRGEAVER